MVGWRTCYVDLILPLSIRNKQVRIGSSMSLKDIIYVETYYHCRLCDIEVDSWNSNACQSTKLAIC